MFSCVKCLYMLFYICNHHAGCCVAWGLSAQRIGITENAPMRFHHRVRMIGRHDGCRNACRRTVENTLTGPPRHVWRICVLFYAATVVNDALRPLITWPECQLDKNYVGMHMAIHHSYRRPFVCGNSIFTAQWLRQKGNKLVFVFVS